MKLNKCPSCKSEVEFDFSGTSKCYGRAFQSAHISCTNTSCLVSLDFCIDFSDIISPGYVVKDKLKDLWNELAR